MWKNEQDAMQLKVCWFYLAILDFMPLVLTQERAPTGLNHTCPEYVYEKTPLDCDCTTTDAGNPQARVGWTKKLNTRLNFEPRLSVAVVERVNEGNLFTCSYDWPSSTGTVRKDVNYELKVAWGPILDDVWIKGPSNFPSDGTRKVTYFFKWAKDAFSPSLTYKWTGKSCAGGNEKQSCTFVPDPETDVNITLFCTVNNTARLSASAIVNISVSMLWTGKARITMMTIHNLTFPSNKSTGLYVIECQNIGNPVAKMTLTQHLNYKFIKSNQEVTLDIPKQKTINVTNYRIRNVYIVWPPPQCGKSLIYRCNTKNSKDNDAMDITVDALPDKCVNNLKKGTGITAVINLLVMAVLIWLGAIGVACYRRHEHTQDLAEYKATNPRIWTMLPLKVNIDENEKDGKENDKKDEKIEGEGEGDNGGEGDIGGEEEEDFTEEDYQAFVRAIDAIIEREKAAASATEASLASEKSSKRRRDSSSKAAPKGAAVKTAESIAGGKKADKIGGGKKANSEGSPGPPKSPLASLRTASASLLPDCSVPPGKERQVARISPDLERCMRSNEAGAPKPLPVPKVPVDPYPYYEKVIYMTGGDPVSCSSGSSTSVDEVYEGTLPHLPPRQKTGDKIKGTFQEMKDTIRQLSALDKREYFEPDESGCLICGGKETYLCPECGPGGLVDTEDW